MNINLILFVILPFVLILAISIGMPLYRKKLMKEAGKKILPLVKKGSALTIAAYVTAYVLFAFSLLVDFGKMNFVIPYCAVAGLFISTKEGTFRSVNGVYENLLISGTDIIKFDDIMRIPGKGESSHPDNVVEIITKKNGKRQLVFDNAGTASEVLKAIKKQVQV